MNFGVRRYLERSRLTQELVEDWKIEHDQAMFARDVEELAGECLELERLAQHTWKGFTEILFSDHVNEFDMDRLGNGMKTALAKSLEAFEIVRSFIARGEVEGHAITDAPKFACALQNIQAVGKEVERYFPPINCEMIEQSLADFKRGAFKSTEDLLREAQSCNPSF